MVVNKILEYLSKNKTEYKEEDGEIVDKGFGLAEASLKKLLFKKSRDSRGKLHMSKVGACPRQVAYAYHGFEVKGREIDPRSMFNFFMGDIVELGIVLLAVKAGVSLSFFGSQQRSVEVSSDQYKLTGRPDGLLEHGNETLNFEVKSMSTYGFRRFEKGDISEEYIAQANAYMTAQQVNRTCFVAVCKDTGVLAEQIIKKNPVIVMQNELNCLRVVNSTTNNLPERPPRLNANPKTGFYPWNCVYCAYHEHCRPEAMKVVVSGAYKLKAKVKDGTLSGQR